MLRTLTPLTDPDPTSGRVASVRCKAHQLDKRQRLCRYISRPPLAVKRLSLSRQGKVVYTLKTPYRDGTTQVVFELVDFIARPAALASPSRAPPPCAITGRAENHAGPIPHRFNQPRLDNGNNLPRDTCPPSPKGG